jgi:hypothetical protein
MSAAHLTLTLITAGANLFSGTCAVLHLRAILPGMAKAGVPESWLTFPIGTLKLAGAAGLLLGLRYAPLSAAAAFGLVLFFVCALYTHIRVGDYTPQFFLAVGFLGLAASTLALAVT